MAIEIKSFSPVKFLQGDDLSLAGQKMLCTVTGMDYCQLVQMGDLTNFQVQLTEAGNNLVSNPGFTGSAAGWVLNAGWAYQAGSENVKHTSGGGAGALTQGLAINIEKYYKVEYTISGFSGTGTLSVELGGVVAHTWAAADNPDGRHADYVRMLPILGGPEIVFDSTNLLNVTIDDVSVKEVSWVGFSIRDEDDNIIYADVSTSAAYYADDYAFISIDWLGFGFDPGCYHICLHDMSVYSAEYFIENGDFDDASAWTLGPVWTIGAGVALYSNPAGGGTEADRTMSQPLQNDLLAGATYRINFDISAYVIGGLEVRIGSTSLGTFTGNGAKTVDYTPLVLVPAGTEFKFLGGTAILSGLELDNVVLDFVDGNQDTVACSECYDLATTHGCTMLLSWENDHNAFCFNYEDFNLGYGGTNLFIQYLRVAARLKNASYPKDKHKPFIDSTGVRRNIYARVDKQSLLEIDYQPEYIHDALSVALEHSNFQIASSYVPQDAGQYVSDEEDYTPDWQGDLLLAKSKIELIKVTPVCDLENSLCT